MGIPAGSEMTSSTIGGASGGTAVVVVIVAAGIEVVVVGGRVVVDVDVVPDGADVGVVVGCEVMAVAGRVVGGCVEGVTSLPLVPQAVAKSTRIASIGRR